MIEDALIEFRKGDTYTRDIKISKYTSPIDKMYFTVKENTDTKRPVLQETLKTGISLVEETEDYRIYNITIQATETDKIKPKDYVFDVEIITEDEFAEDIKQTIISGIFRLTSEVTATANEK